jgi:hypothetical protein
LLVAQETVWVFMGAEATFPSAVFQTTAEAEEWICKHRLTGVLTRYPVGISVLDWVIEKGHFSPRPERLLDPNFVGRFSSAHTAHFHYEDGLPAGHALDPTPGAMETLATSTTKIRFNDVAYRQGFVEVLPAIHPRMVNIETWSIHPDIDISDRELEGSLYDEHVIGHTEIELNVAEARALAERILRAITLIEEGRTQSEALASMGYPAQPD